MKISSTLINKNILVKQPVYNKDQNKAKLIPHAKSLHLKLKEKKNTLSVKKKITYQMLNIKKEEYKNSNKKTIYKSKSSVYFDASIASSTLIEDNMNNYNKNSGSEKKLKEINTQSHIFKFKHLEGFINISRSCSTPNLNCLNRNRASNRFSNRKKIEEINENNFIVNKERIIESENTIIHENQTDIIKSSSKIISKTKSSENFCVKLEDNKCCKKIDLEGEINILRNVFKKVK